MAYDRNEIFEKAKKAIENNYLIFIEEVVAFLPISKPTFYSLFPLDSNEFNDLKELLEEQKIQKKATIRAKLMKGEKAAELLAYYRLICTPEERKMLNQQYIDHTTKGNEINQSPTFVFKNLNETE